MIKRRRLLARRRFVVKRPIIIAAIPVLILSAAALAGVAVFEQQTAPAAATIVEEITNTLSLAAEDVTVNIESGQTYGIAPTTIAVTAGNLSSGYTIQLHVENSDLTPESSNDSSAGSASKISALASATTPVALSDNTWGISYSAPAGASAQSWYGIPSDSTSPLTLYSTNNAITSERTDTHTFYYGAKISPELPSGVYSGTLVYTVITGGRSCSNSNEPGIEPCSDPVTPDPVTPDPATPDPVSVPGFFDVSTMQKMTSDVCSTIIAPSAAATTIVTGIANYTDPATQVPQVTLIDKRDNKTYQVRKLADGECWMAQNLRLAAGVALDSSNTDNPASDFSLVSSSSWGTANPPTTAYVNTTGAASNGYWYNWKAATADTGDGIATGDATGSICPKNWGLPTSSQFNTLLSTYSVTSNGYGAKIIADPISMPYAGGWSGSSSYGVGLSSDYWSRTAYGASSARILYFSNGSAGVSNFRRSNGNLVRCLVK